MDVVLVDYVLSFLECAVHNILFVRHVYPEILFEQKRFLGVTVWQSRHPDINSYIRRVMSNLKPMLSKVRYNVYDFSFQLF
jgi:hypothetical protein